MKCRPHTTLRAVRHTIKTFSPEMVLNFVKNINKIKENDFVSCILKFTIITVYCLFPTIWYIVII